MKSYINNLEIKTNKYSNINKTFLIISDIHLTNKKGINNLEKIKKDLDNKFESIDYILIPGDIIDDGADLLIEENRKIYKKALEKFINNKKTIIVLGNHDLNNNDNSILSFKEMFKNMKNITILENGEILNDDIISFMGIIPNKEYYYDYKEDINKYEKIVLSKCKNKFKKNTFNIILTHSPISILEFSKKNNKNTINDSDLVISGHMHNGLVPVFLQKLLKGKGFIGPFKKIFANHCYGTYKINNTTFIINGAVNTYIRNKFINNLFRPKATIINVRDK